MFFEFCLGVLVDVNVSAFFSVLLLVLIVLPILPLVVWFELLVVRFYFVLYLIWILLAIFSSFCCLLSLVVGWYLLVWLVLKVRLTLFWSMIHLVFVLLYLTKAVFSVYLVLHHLVGLYFNVLIFLSLRFLKIFLDDSSFFRWCIHLYISLFSACLSIRPFIHPVVRSAQYLKNRTSTNHYFWYTCVK